MKLHLTKWLKTMPVFSCLNFKAKKSSLKKASQREDVDFLIAQFRPDDWGIVMIVIEAGEKNQTPFKLQ